MSRHVAVVRKWTVFSALALWYTMTATTQAQSPPPVPQAPPAVAGAEPATDAAPQSRASLGVTLSDNKQGKVWIRDVSPGSGADQAGLRPNDQILAIDDRKIFTYLDVIRIVNLKGASEDIQVHILRNGKPGMLTASLGAQYAGTPPQGTFTEYPTGATAVTGRPSNSPPPQFVNPNGAPPVSQRQIQP